MKHIDSALLKILRPLLRSHPDLAIETGTKHSKLRNIQSGDWLPLAGSPSDHRAIKNFKAALNRLIESGQGFIYAKNGNLPMRTALS